MTYRIHAAAAVLAAMIATPAFAQDSATANSSAEIIDPIDIENVTPLAFGVIAKPAAGSGTVTINADTGARSATGGVALVTGGSTGRAHFTVEGDANRAFTTTIPATFTLSDGTNDITVTTLAEAAPATALDGSGDADIYVGGTFTVSSATVAAAYTGSFQVTVAYN